MTKKDFLRSVKKTGTCWLWTGRTDKGRYGLAPGGKQAHRLAYEFYKGPIPKGLVIAHQCDNPPCVRPSHLEAQTNFENLLDARRKGHVRSGRLHRMVECGLRARKKYGDNPFGWKRAQENYRKWARKHSEFVDIVYDLLRDEGEEITRDEVDRMITSSPGRRRSIPPTWSDEDSIEGLVVLVEQEGQEKAIPVGARARYYESLSF